jgi:antitoxin component YwqK of YwqJK toxin-antitoxin module
MKRLLLIVLPLLLIVGCSSPEPINYETTLVERDGLYTNWYENGQKRFEVTYEDGELISEKYWNEDGSVKE